jgi:hypothetical protein
MMACERCGTETDRLLRRRAYGVAMTHRVTRWLCRDCHPGAPALEPPVSDAEADRPADSVVTDGGTTTTCPECAASTANVQGIRNCVECRWYGH